jgi:hypothetical protein
MAEFQWWLLLVGLVAGGGLGAIVSMDGRRRDEDLAALERRAETTWIAERLAGRDPAPDARTIEAILRIHREYLSLPPPDRLLVGRPEPSDGDPVLDPDDVRLDGRRGTDDDLPGT